MVKRVLLENKGRTWVSPYVQQIVSLWGEGDIDHPIAFASRKLSDSKQNYNTTEREGLDMVYALHKYRHYLLGQHFKMFTDHSAIRYLVNKPVLGERICRWLLLFQEFDFEVVVKPGRLNAGPDHLSKITNGEELNNSEDNFPDAQLFSVQIVDEYFANICSTTRVFQQRTNTFSNHSHNWIKDQHTDVFMW
jgi:hypothetical protein